MAITNNNMEEKHAKLIFPISAEEIKHLELTVNRQGNQFDYAWRKAFIYYNYCNKTSLSMQCFPCYKKVLQFIKIKLTQ